MKITMGLMADYASIDAAGKMYLVGVFGRLNYPTYPLTLQMMYLALKLDIPMSEWDKSRTLTIRLVGEDKPESGSQNDLKRETCASYLHGEPCVRWQPSRPSVLQPFLIPREIRLR